MKTNNIDVEQQPLIKIIAFKDDSLVDAIAQKKSRGWAGGVERPSWLVPAPVSQPYPPWLYCRSSYPSVKHLYLLCYHCILDFSRKVQEGWNGIAAREKKTIRDLEMGMQRYSERVDCKVFDGSGSQLLYTSPSESVLYWSARGCSYSVLSRRVWDWSQWHQLRAVPKLWMDVSRSQEDLNVKDAEK